MRVTIDELRRSLEDHLRYLEDNGVREVDLSGVHCWRVLPRERFLPTPPEDGHALSTLAEEWNDIQDLTADGGPSLPMNLDALGDILQYLSWQYS